MKKTILIVSVSVASVILMVVIFVFVLFSFLKKEQNKEYYDFGSDQVPSITFVLGKRGLSGSSLERNNGVTMKRYTYRSEDGMGDGKAYVEYLMGTEGFERMESSDGVICYKKESSDTGMELTVSVVVGAKSVSVTVVKEEARSFVYKMPVMNGRLS